VFCQNSPAQRAAIRAYSNGTNVPLAAQQDYHYFLPSLNLKFDILPNLYARFSLSRSMTPPLIGYVRNDFNLQLPAGVATSYLTDATGKLILDANGNPQGLHGIVTVGNPHLKPETSDNADLSFEWYFADVGSVTLATFYKRLHDVIVNNSSLVPYTNNGQTFNMVQTQPGNSSATGTVRGVEFGYRQTYDFLPGLLSGLGLDTNYTLLWSSGVPQSTLSSTDPDVGAGRVANINTALLPLECLSKQTFNAAGIYEKGPVQARLAWSWRSKFLLTTRDVIVPYAPIMNENIGQLDASFFYNVTTNIKLGFQGANLTDSITRTSQVLNDHLLRAGRSWFIEDRRYSLIVRATF
jgi:TonB-dependent receptor